MSVNLVFHYRMEHIVLDIQFVCDHVTKGVLYVAYISTKDQLVDVLTKPLPHQQFSIL